MEDAELSFITKHAPEAGLDIARAAMVAGNPLWRRLASTNLFERVAFNRLQLLALSIARMSDLEDAREASQVMLRHLSPIQANVLFYEPSVYSPLARQLFIDRLSSRPHSSTQGIDSLMGAIAAKGVDLNLDFLYSSGEEFRGNAMAHLVKTALVRGDHEQPDLIAVAQVFARHGIALSQPNKSHDAGPSALGLLLSSPRINAVGQWAQWIRDDGLISASDVDSALRSVKTPSPDAVALFQGVLAHQILQRMGRLSSSVVTP